MVGILISPNYTMAIMINFVFVYYTAIKNWEKIIDNTWHDTMKQTQAE